MLKLFSFFFVICFFIAQNIYYSQHLFNPLNQNYKIIKSEPGHEYITTHLKNGEIEVTDIDLTEVLDILVEFTDVPYLVKKQRKHNISISSYQNTFEKFRDDITKLENRKGTQNFQFSSVEVKKEFYKLFFGVSIKVSKGLINEIHNLDYVKKIHLNKKVEAYLDKSIAKIKADSVWYQFGTEGDSIIVAIIDTGIDYLHPALGGGYGDGFKVIGGYDFVNDDDDPIDDEGHGTHVAGIVAANGDSVKGVAPKASLIAVKVLNEYGSGTFEDVIEGIEYCVDPNDDGDIEDRVDIANMSLGAYGGDPEDPASTAVDNASILGVTFCISAGNSGAYKSIGSPGCAAEAITVGATDDEDNLAYFSSKGPTNKTYAIKPDVLAPGVNINSLELGDGMVEYSGTSMSSPHVAGVCALLKSINPGWGPKEIKSALITSAVDLGEEVMAQGSGRIDALKATEANTFVYPANVSLGLVDNNDSIWISVDTIFISNKSPYTLNYILSTDMDIPGLALEISTNSFSLSANEDKEVYIQAKIDNSILAYPSNKFMSYTGLLNIYDGTQLFNIPLGVSKSSKLIIKSDIAHPSVRIYNDNFYTSVRWEDDFFHTEVDLPKGVYDIYATYWSDTLKHIVEEGLTIDGGRIYDLKFNENLNNISIKGVDENGSFFHKDQKVVNSLTVLFPDELGVRSIGYASRRAEIVDAEYQISDVSNKYQFSFAQIQYDIEKDHEVRAIHHKMLSGVNLDETIINNAEDYNSRKVKFRLPKNSSNLSLVQNELDYSRNNYSIGFNWDDLEVDDNFWEGEVFLCTDSTNNYLESISFLSSFAESLGDGWTRHYYTCSTPMFREYNNFLYSYNSLDIPTNYSYLNHEQAIEFGQNTICPRTSFLNDLGQYFEGNFWFSLDLLGMFNEVYPFAFNKEVKLELRNMENKIVLSDSLMPFLLGTIPEEKYIINYINKSYNLNNLEGMFSYTSEFDLSKPDFTPPTITSFILQDNQNRVKNHFENGDSINLRISVADSEARVNGFSIIEKYSPINLAWVKLYIKPNVEENWTERKFELVSIDTVSGLSIKIPLSDLNSYDSSSVDIKMSYHDASENKVEWILSPAFTVGKYPIITDINEHVHNDEIIPLTYKLGDNYPNPFNPTTTIRFEIPKQEHVSLKVYDLLGREVKSLVNEVKKPGRYQANWSGRNNLGGQLASGIYFYRIETQSYSKSKKMILLK